MVQLETRLKTIVITWEVHIPSKAHGSDGHASVLGDLMGSPYPMEGRPTELKGIDEQLGETVKYSRSF